MKMFESDTSKKEVLDKYFENPEVLKFDGFPEGGIEIIDLDPQEKKTDTPLMIIPGWAATAEVCKENSQIFSEELGRRTITINAPHGIETNPQEDTPLAELRKAVAITKIMEAKNIEKVDVLTHSEGALFTTIAAMQNPEKFRSIVYFAPAGLIGEDNFWQLISRFSSDLFQQWKDRKKSPERESKINTALIEALKTFRNPKMSLDEIMAIADSQIQENLRELKQSGVKIIIMHPVGDKAFPMERMQRMVDGGMVNGFISVGDAKKTGEVAETHNAWYLTPRKYTLAIDSILKSIEEKEQYIDPK